MEIKHNDGEEDLITRSIEFNTLVAAMYILSLYAWGQ